MVATLQHFQGVGYVAMLARMERSVRALFRVFQPVFMRVSGNLSSIFRTVLTLQNGRKLHSFRVFTGLLRIVFPQSLADISGVFRRSFYAFFGNFALKKQANVKLIKK